jgi:hypothetical protein
MKSVVFSVAVLCSLTCYSQKTKNRETPVTQFEIKLEKYTSDFLVFYKDLGNTEVNGFIYNVNDSLKVKLFTTFTGKDSLTISESVLLNRNDKLRAKKVLYRIKNYPDIPCYAGIKNVPEPGIQPRISHKEYWFFIYKFLEKNDYKRVYRDKLTLKKDDCNKFFRKLRERRDFRRLYRLVNKAVKNSVVKS